MITRTLAACALGVLALGLLPRTAAAAELLAFDLTLPDAPAPAKVVARYAVIPLQDMATDAAIGQAEAGATVPVWSTTIADGGSSFRFAMVGNNPEVAEAKPSTTIRSFLIPVDVDFKKFGVVFDPTVADPVCAANIKHATPLTLAGQGPMFNDISLTLGGTALGSSEYADLFQRANFFKFTGPGGINPDYHVLLGNTVLLASKVTLNIAGGSKPTAAPCGKLGQISMTTFDGFLRNTVIPKLPAEITTATLPIFLLYGVVLTDGGCCVLGYHSAFSRGGVTQTYAVADFDTTRSFKGSTDVSAMSHEIAEWLDDPLGNNPTKAWGHIGQVSGCQNNLEVGDPLSGNKLPAVTMASNKFTYHVQDLAFLSWFYHQKPSIGVNGWYSLFGTFRMPAAACR